MLPTPPASLLCDRPLGGGVGDMFGHEDATQSIHHHRGAQANPAKPQTPRHGFTKSMSDNKLSEIQNQQPKLGLSGPKEEQRMIGKACGDTITSLGFMHKIDSGRCIRECATL
ncbi:hypothetical protein CYMTET_3375 [Cymbomonas tetramitiformis]|uniref:Uncharacterized protein n=1 Tax=Cymbomonas tetramitiformis TaxID=36881 RepID=A0AAE0LL55_9CHLO|nr:hypothetical protein CYMTET_3375 [Cymbomonas tetramitiformis]